MKYFYLIYFFPSTLVSGKHISKVPPFLSVICLSPNDFSGVFKAAQLGFEILEHFLFLLLLLLLLLLSSRLFFSCLLSWASPHVAIGLDKL